MSEMSQLASFEQRLAHVEGRQRLMRSVVTVRLRCCRCRSGHRAESVSAPPSVTASSGSHLITKGAAGAGCTIT
jgi:hypothetical protein